MVEGDGQNEDIGTVIVAGCVVCLGAATLIHEGALTNEQDVIHSVGEQAVDQLIDQIHGNRPQSALATPEDIYLLFERVMRECVRLLETRIRDVGRGE